MTDTLPDFPIHPDISQAGYDAYRAVANPPDGAEYEESVRRESDAIVRAVIVASTFHADPVAWEFEQRDPDTQQWATVLQRDRHPPGSQARNERPLIYRHAVAAVEPAHALVGFVDEPSLESYQGRSGRALRVYADSEAVRMPVRLVLVPPNKPAYDQLEERCRELEAQLAQAQQRNDSLSTALTESTAWMQDCVKDVLHPVAHLATSLGAAAEGFGGASVAILQQASAALNQPTAQ